MKKRALCFFLALLICLSLLPVSVLASDDALEAFRYAGEAAAVTGAYYSTNETAAPKFIHTYLCLSGAFLPYRDRNGKVSLALDAYMDLAEGAFAWFEDTALENFLSSEGYLSGETVSFTPVKTAGGLQAWEPIFRDDNWGLDLDEVYQIVSGFYLSGAPSSGNCSRKYDGTEYAVCQLVMLYMDNGRIAGFEKLTELADVEGGMLYRNDGGGDYKAEESPLYPVTVESGYTAYLRTGNGYTNDYLTYYYAPEKGLTIELTPDSNGLYTVKGVKFTSSGGAMTVTKYTTESEPEGGGDYRVYTAPKGLTGAVSVEAVTEKNYTISDGVLKVGSLSAYHLTFDTSENFEAGGIIYGGGATRETILLPKSETGSDSYNGRGETDYYLWPDSETSIMVSTYGDYKLSDLELYPADAGTFSVTNGDGTQGAIRLSLNAPATVRLKSRFTEGWQQTDGKWRYQNADGSFPADQWKKIGRSWYFFDQDGFMKTGWINSGATWYYLKPSGAMATRWAHIGSSWYYFGKGGALQTGWLESGGVWYYLKPSGAMATGWEKVGRSWYYFDKGGAMQTGWLNSGGVWYYLQPSGAMTTGWLKQGGVWYYLKPSGVMATGWCSVGGTWYYFDADGAMQTGWLQQGNTWYYLKPGGAMAAGETIGRYSFDTGGAWIE